MHFKSCVLSLLAGAAVVAALPADNAAKIQAGLRLIKTSEEDAGTWVTEEAKISDYVAKGKHFIDITEITDNEVLTRMSTKSDGSVQRAAAVTYPAAVSRQTVANPLIAQVTTTNPQSWLKTMTDYFNRYYRSTYGTQAGTWLFNTVKSVASANSKIVVTQFTHSFNQPSIIARIPGTSPNLVIVGAHYDSTGGSATARGPGADDDGSGVVVILEALRVLAQSGYAPKNTLEFHFYGGEEGGLLGSGAIFSNYKSTGKNVLAFVNQDMAGYSPSGKISIYNDYSDTSLNTYVKKVINAYGGGSYTTDTCGYGCSDHASAYNNGFPAAYVCDEPIDTSSPYIHSPNDAYSTVQWPTVLRHAKFTVGFLVEASYI
ncbi:Leucine aminopeptidase 1 [Sphaceloma murrayae]|uniref:Peptide hydrolase n=1 Tax=Sphaceloma murrayae TaxID=2082308 RepID=A0A2K1QJZ8_9PEZI|nr:Leucine aminopeptidase 1 [Sphaceloma murrayae]